jgi:hypothetical protein
MSAGGLEIEMKTVGEVVTVASKCRSPPPRRCRRRSHRCPGWQLEERDPDRDWIDFWWRKGDPAEEMGI